MSKHGGVRARAGRPHKYDFDEIVTIGHACEKLWREASKAAGEAHLASLPHAAEIRALQEGARHRPVQQRVEWLKSDAYDDHKRDLESFLHDRAGTPFDFNSAEYEGDPPREVTISTKPPHGTRKRIIGDVSTESGLSKNAVDNLWQAYRRVKQELLDLQET